MYRVLIKRAGIRPLWPLHRVFSLLAALYACATAAQREEQKIISTGSEARQKGLACRVPIRANPLCARRDSKMALEPAQMPTPAQLSDREIISDDDIAHGLEWYAEIQQCDRASIETYGRLNDPGLSQLLTRVTAYSTEIVAAVAEQKPTYGAINAKIAQFRTEQKEAAQAWAERTKMRLQGQQEQELAEREELFALFVSVVASIAARQVVIVQAQRRIVAAQPGYVPRHHVTVLECGGDSDRWSCELTISAGQI